MMTTSHYFRKDKYGREFFDYRAYDDDEQMKELKKKYLKNKKNAKLFLVGLGGV